MELYLVYSGSQEDEDGVRGIYDSLDNAVDNARILMRAYRLTENFRPVGDGWLPHWESESGYYRIYIDAEILNKGVLE